MNKKKLKQLIKQKIREHWFVFPCFYYYMFINPKTMETFFEHYSGRLFVYEVDKKGEVTFR